MDDERHWYLERHSFKGYMKRQLAMIAVLLFVAGVLAGIMVLIHMFLGWGGL